MRTRDFKLVLVVICGSVSMAPHSLLAADLVGDAAPAQVADGMPGNLESRSTAIANSALGPRTRFSYVLGDTRSGNVAAPKPVTPQVSTAKSSVVLASSFALAGGEEKPVAEPASSAIFGSGYSLEDLLRMALRSYPTVLAKQMAKVAAESDLLAAKLKFLPTPTVSTQQAQVYSGQRTSTRPATTISLSQPLFTGGALMAGYDKAGARLSAAELGVLESREEVSKRLINAYVEWTKAYRKILALEESVRLHEKFAGLIKRRFASGVASGADRNLGLSRLEQVGADLESQRSIEKSVLTSISELVGQPITREDLLKRMAQPKALPARQQGIDQALNVSPMLRRYRFEAEAAEAEAREVRAQGMPQLLLQAQRQIGNTTIDNAPDYNTLGLVVQYAPGGGFSSFASSTAAFERARAVAMQTESARRDLTDRLNTEYNEYDFSKLKQSGLQRSVDLSADISDSYDRQYLAGRKSWLDLMTAVREQAQTRLSLADAEASVLGASWRIAVSVGGTESFEFSANGQ